MIAHLLTVLLFGQVAMNNDDPDTGIYLANPPRPFVFAISGKNWKRCKDFAGQVDCEYWDEKEQRFVPFHEQLERDRERLIELKQKPDNDHYQDEKGEE